MLLALLAAASADPRCSSIKTDDLFACASAEYKQADAALNVAYRDAMAKAKQQDGYVPARDRAENNNISYPQSLLTAQRAWLAYRDAECATQIWDSAGGHERPIYKLGCLTTLTKARTRQLRDDFSQGH